MRPPFLEAELGALQGRGAVGKPLDKTSRRREACFSIPLPLPNARLPLLTKKPSWEHFFSHCLVLLCPLLVPGYASSVHTPSLQAHPWARGLDVLGGHPGSQATHPAKGRGTSSPQGTCSASLSRVPPSGHTLGSWPGVEPPPLQERALQSPDTPGSPCLSPARLPSRPSLWPPE